MTPDTGDLLETLPPPQRVALVYAPRGARAPTLALLALDARLARIVRVAREPVLAQLKLAWWRDRLCEEPNAGPEGEPLLTALRATWTKPRTLLELVDGWEATVGDEQERAVAALGGARAAAWSALHAELGCTGDSGSAQRAGYRWGMAELRAHLTDPAERASAVWLVEEAVRNMDMRLPRAMRPLAVLDALAQRSLIRPDGNFLTGPGDLAVAMRVGLFGR